MIIIHSREKNFIHNCMKKCGCLYIVYCIVSFKLYCKGTLPHTGPSPWRTAQLYMSWNMSCLHRRLKLGQRHNTGIGSPSVPQTGWQISIQIQRGQGHPPWQPTSLSSQPAWQELLKVWLLVPHTGENTAGHTQSTTRVTVSSADLQSESPSHFNGLMKVCQQNTTQKTSSFMDSSIKIAEFF